MPKMRQKFLVALDVSQLINIVGISQNSIEVHSGLKGQRSSEQIKLEMFVGVDSRIISHPSSFLPRLPSSFFT